MPASLRVDLNGSVLHDIDAPDEFTVSGPFSVELLNHGEAVHVHINLDDELSRVARLHAGNHYVESERNRLVRVDVKSVEQPQSGKLKIVTGYGAETHYVDVTVEPEVEQKEPVDVDESLAKPRQHDATEAPIDRIRGAAEEASLPVLALGAFAIVLALGIGIVASSTPVTLAAGVVILGVVAAIAFLLRQP